MIIPLRLSLFVVMLVAIHINSNIKNKHPHHRILTLLLLTYLLHNTLLIPIWIISGDTLLYIDLAVPFGLMYGPLLFFYYMSLRKYKMSRVIVFANILPILISWCLYFIFILNENVRNATTGYYYSILYGCIGISLASYSFFILIREYKSKNQVFSHFLFFLIISGIFMMYLSYQMFGRTLVVGGGTQEVEANLTVTLFMLLGGLLWFDFVFRLFKSDYQPKTSRNQNSFHYVDSQKVVKRESENKNESEDELLKPIIENFFTSEYIVDNTMDLKKAANILDMTQSKLQNSIYVVFGVSFSKLLTIKRVDYAGKLILENGSSEIPDNLYDLSGFKSKSTFYRNFANIMGCSPSQYKATYNVS